MATPAHPLQKVFRFKSEIVKAAQWFKNGDHPLDYSQDEQGMENGVLRTFTGEERKAKGWEGSVVRYFRSPDMPGRTVCGLCGNTMHSHGWIDGARNQGISHVVCPGDWVVTDKEGKYSPYRAETFARIFEPVSD